MARYLVCACEVVARDEGVRVVLAKDADTVGEELLVQGVGLNEVARRMVSVCEVVE